MTNQEKKRYLSRYRVNELEIARTLEELERWRSLAEKVTVELRGMPGAGSGKGNQVLSSVEQIDRIQRRLDEQVCRRVKLREEIEQAIAEVEEERLRALLKYRYIDGMTWERVAVIMNYSWRQICNLHGRALEELKIA